jgi:hypothetical protein
VIYGKLEVNPHGEFTMVKRNVVRLRAQFVITHRSEKSIQMPSDGLRVHQVTHSLLLFPSLFSLFVLFVRTLLRHDTPPHRAGGHRHCIDTHVLLGRGICEDGTDD